MNYGALWSEFHGNFAELQPPHIYRSTRRLARATSQPVMLVAAALLAPWLATCEALRQAMVAGKLVERASELASGAPRWRAVIGLFFQATIFSLFAIFTARGSGGAPSRLGAVAGELFLLVFAAFMLYDFAVLDMRPVLQAHHYACLVCHAYAASLGTRDAAFRWYFAGVAALEAGSAACNLWCLYPADALWFYVVGMTVSNFASVDCVRRWAKSTTVASRTGRVLSVTVLVVLAAIRQKMALDEAPVG